MIELRANKETFHTITFNKVGVSIIRAIKVSEDKKSTYNSTGKSLLIYLIHFCLGGSENQELKEKLPEWEFSLDFLIDDVPFTATRNVDNQKFVRLNEKEYKLSEYTDWLQSKTFFNIPNEFKYISFRSLINRFIRPKKSSYDTYNCYLKEEVGYQELLNNSYLLGLDISRISKKKELKEEWDTTKEKKKNIENDSIMREFFTGDSDKKKIDLEIIGLEKKLERLTKSIAEFKVAEDYDSIRKEADEISEQLKRYKNRRSVIFNAINNIEKSLDIRPDISSKDIQNLFEDAKININESIKRRFDEVEDFNRKLLGNRKARLLDEKKQFESQLNELDGIIRMLGKAQDEKLSLLQATGSLEEYSKLNEQCSQVQIKYNKLVDYKELLGTYNSKIDEIKEAFVKENSDTNKYLKEIELLKKRNIEVFNSFAEQFYQNKTSGIIIENNEGENQSRFNIEATIDSDSGDGVNNVKIFCFDWTILKTQNNHNVKFIFHDSRLISEIDPRQIATMFYLSNFHTNEFGLQYIITANQKELDALKSEFTEEEYQKFIEKNIVEELTDESDESKLLGITIDLNYEK
ncbi:MAG: hypothetical protein A2281_17675 [Bacteroidetes bacterium RIFOXYA12_FULL_38_20]|nr:MAG: hypothetical protein A2281_17675 [Bacteroidetes bacterium RIFOXYA12_FULL_38_20]